MPYCAYNFSSYFVIYVIDLRKLMSKTHTVISSFIFVQGVSEKLDVLKIGLDAQPDC